MRSEAESRRLLMALMTRHQRQIFGYIYTLVPDRSAAEDLLQETSLVVCEKFEEFEEGTDFVSWACQIAYWRVRYSRQKYVRSKVVFDQDIVEVVAQTANAEDVGVPRWLLLIHSIPPRPDYLRVKIGRRLQKLGPQRLELRLVKRNVIAS